MTWESLPKAITSFSVPQFFSPSVLGAAVHCRLKTATASSRAAMERLAAGPEAAIGVLCHRVLERCSKEFGAEPRQVFDEEYARACDELRVHPRRAHYFDLASTRPRAQWLQLRGWILKRASTARPVPTPPTGITSRRVSSLGGSEIGLQSVSLRLRGAADRVRKVDGNTVEIRDYKTGEIFEYDGSLKPAIVIQMQAYGLMAMESSGVTDVHLIVDDGDEHELPFTRDIQAEARERLVAIVEQLPEAGLQQAMDFASPGSDCFGCAIRHTCAAYLNVAPSWWKSYPASVDRLPHDTWGELVDIHQGSSNTVLLKDEAGRRVRIDGVDKRHGIQPESIGRKFYFFNLQATGSCRDFGGRRFHPSSFHEHARDSSERRAWSAEVFWS